MSTDRRFLDDVAEVRGGYIPPKSETRVQGLELRTLQGGDVATDGTIVWAALRRVPAFKGWERFVVRDGDVILPLRSTRIAATVARGVPADVVAVGSWALLTAHQVRLDADYLAWYLNHPAVTPRLAALARGSTLPFLTIAAVRAFEVELPPLETQRAIARTTALHQHVVELEQQLAHARKQLVDSLTMDALRRTSGTDSSLR